MKNLILLIVFALVSLGSQAQTDSLATVHFYSFEPAQGDKKAFAILQNQEPLTTQEEGGEVMINVEPGVYTFSLQPGSGSLALTLQPGVIYFILCTTTGTLVRRTQSEAENDLKKVRGN